MNAIKTYHWRSIISFLIFSGLILFLFIFIDLVFHLSLKIRFSDWVWVWPIVFIWGSSFFIYLFITGRSGFKLWKKKKYFLWVSSVLFPLLFLYSASLSSAAYLDLPLSCGFNPISLAFLNLRPFPIHVTDSLLDQINHEKKLVTTSRIRGEIIEIGDRSFGIQSCQKSVNIQWKNESLKPITIEDRAQSISLIIQPGKSETIAFGNPGVYPYTLNQNPHFIHIGSSDERESHTKYEELNDFCHEHAKGEIRIVFNRLVDSQYLHSLFEKSELKLIQRQPFNTVIAAPISARPMNTILPTLEQDPAFLIAEPDCLLGGYE